MARRKATDNRQVVAVPVFVPDPVGHRMFADITANVHAPLVDSPAVIERGMQWGGWARDPQRFRGMAALTRTRPIVDRGSKLEDERSLQLANPALAVFAQRATRGQS